MDEQEQENDNGRRYYPNSLEQSILVQNVRRYFSKPERSQERTKIANEVSEELMKHSPHWTHRTVRLWFNNNKHTYSGEQQHDADSSNSQNVIQQQAKQNQINQQKNQQIQKASNINNNSGYQNSIQFGFMNPQFYQNQSNEQKRGSLYQTNSKLQMGNNGYTDIQQIYNELNQIMEKAMGANEIEMQNLITKHDELTGIIKSIKGFDPSYSNFTVKKEKSTSIMPLPPEKNMLETNFSSGEADQATFGQLFPRGLTPDPFWREKRFEDYTICSFDANYLNSKSASFVHNANNTPERAISYAFNLGSSSKITWKTMPLGITRRIESLVVDESNFNSWMYSNGSLYRYDFYASKLDELNLNISQFPISIELWNGNPLISFSDSSNIYIINNDQQMSKKIINTPFQNLGISCLCSLDNYIVCSLGKSNAMYLLDTNTSNVIRSFIGHNASPIFLNKISSNLFASASDDRSVKIWDIRQHCPIMSIGYPESITAINVTKEYLFVATSTNRDRHVYVTSIKNEPSQYLGIGTAEYIVSSLRYYENDSLFLFANASREGIADSLLFMNDDGSSCKYILRRYNQFLNI